MIVNYFELCGMYVISEEGLYSVDKKKKIGVDKWIVYINKS